MTAMAVVVVDDQPRALAHPGSWIPPASNASAGGAATATEPPAAGDCPGVSPFPEPLSGSLSGAASSVQPALRGSPERVEVRLRRRWPHGADHGALRWPHIRVRYFVVLVRADGAEGGADAVTSRSGPGESRPDPGLSVIVSERRQPSTKQDRLLSGPHIPNMED